MSVGVNLKVWEGKCHTLPTTGATGMMMSRASCLWEKQRGK